MPLTLPKIDDRTYRDLVDEALTRIPVHNPEYTNFNDADPGVTLLQLFAFMAESVGYRANLIPERNRLAFLRLLGVPLAAAEPARGLAAFSNPRGALATMGLAAGEEILAAQAPFGTENAVEVLPVEGRLYTKSRLSAERRAEVEELYRRLYASHEAPGATGGQLDYYETRPLATSRAGASLPEVNLGRDTVDGALWLALLARPGDDLESARQAIGGRVLSLGVVPAVEGGGRVLAPGSVSAAGTAAGLVVEAPVVGPEPEARYRRLEVRSGRDLTAFPGVAEVVLPAAAELAWWDGLDPLEAGVGAFPPSLADSDDGERLLTWLRIRTARSGSGTTQLATRFSWLGINAAEIVQQARVEGELLPRGTGEPDQTASLVNTPALVRSVRLTVDGELWQRIDDLAAAAPEVPPPGTGPGSAEGPPAEARVYTVDRESGEIRFGDGARGARPPAGALIQASYAWGGGRRGMVGIDAVTKGPSLPAGVKVTNPVPTWGGDEAETPAEAERRIPRYLAHRDRLVSEEDFLDVVTATPGVDLGRAEVLPLFHPDLGEGLAPGVVTLLVVPRYGGEAGAPSPDQLFLDALARHLAPRRLLTTELHVRGPAYVPVRVSLGVEVVPGTEQGPVLRAVDREVRRFLSPLEGGFEGKGWPLRKAVDRLEVAAAASRVAGVSKVSGVLLGDAAGTAADAVEMRGLELPRIAGLAVSAGGAIPLDEGGPPPDTEPTRLIPVPVVPDGC